MLFNFKSKKTRALEDKVAELTSKAFDLERELFQSQQFERVACDKLKTWVEKHDALLVFCKTHHDTKLTS